MATAPQAFTNNPGETGMTVWWQPAPPPGDDVNGLVLEVREFPQPWDSARAIDMPAGVTEFRVSGLVPTATFEFRLRYRLRGGALGPPGQVATADTLVAGCTPKSEEGSGGEKKKKGCATQ